MDLWSNFYTNKGKKIDKWAHYFPAYERHFCRFRGHSIVFVEIGCGGGGSLEMWRNFFGPFAQIVGIDIRPECKKFESEQISVRIGDQTDPELWESVLHEFGPPHIVLDDGSHIMEHVNATFNLLYHRLDSNGVYLVEDLHTAYRAEYGGGYRHQNSFIETCKNLLDQLNADHAREAISPSRFTRETTSLHFYDSIAVFERGRRPPNFPVQSGG
jgi:hypothetical protein